MTPTGVNVSCVSVLGLGSICHASGDLEYLKLHGAALGRDGRRPASGHACFTGRASVICITYWKHVRPC